MKTDQPPKGIPGATANERQAGARARSIGSWVFSILLIAGVIAFLVYRGRIADSDSPGTRLAFGEDAIYYSGSATSDDAKALGQVLKEAGFFTDKGSDVILWRGKGPSVVSFVCKTGIWENRNLILQYEDLGRRIAPVVGGFPITVRMLDNRGRARRDIRAGLFVSGVGDRIYYFGKANESDARRADELFRAAKYFVGSGGMALLSKEDTLTVSYVVNELAWVRPEFYASFQMLTRQFAGAIGVRTPVTLRFLNSSMEVKKELLIQ